MAVDIAPELYEEIQRRFQEKMNKAELFGSPISETRKKLEAGTATFVDADLYAVNVGSFISESMLEVLTLDELPNRQLYYNIARRTIGQSLQDTYGLVSSVAAEIQEELNAANGIGLKAITPQANKERINGLVDKAVEAPDQAALEKVLKSPVENLVMSAVDDTVKANAELQSKAGLQPIIKRSVLSKCCDWCSALAGTYKYPDNVPKDVYRRHQNCRCTVEYVGAGKRQDVWSKKEDVLTKKEAQDIEEEILYNTVSNQWISGARILDPESEYAQEWAKSYYEEIRNKSTDCVKIAERLNLEKSDIEKVKDYLFFSGTWYNEITGEYEPFIPDAAIAQSWQRLAEAKKIMPHDKTLIDHELYEMQLKIDNPDISHDEAHSMATLKYDYQSQADQYYADLRERKKRK